MDFTETVGYTTYIGKSVCLNLKGSMMMRKAVLSFLPLVGAVLWLSPTTILAQDKDKDGLRDKILELNKITGNNAMEGRLRELARDADGTKKLLAAAAKIIKEKDQPLNYNALFILARAAHILKQNEQAEALYKAATEKAIDLQSASRIIQVYDGVIDLFYDSKQYDDAIKKCREFLEMKNERGSELNRVKPFVMEKMIQAMAKKGMVDDAMKLADSLVEIDGDEGWYFVRLKGDILREFGKHEEAAKSYLLAIDRLKKSKEIEDEQRKRFTRGLRYGLSGIYVDLKQVEKGAEQLRLLLKDEPDSAVFSNDLGFILADHDMQLDEAEKLIQKALDESRKARKKIENLPKEDDHDNPAYLDSMGWVMFKKKKYEDAKKYLEEAIKYDEGKHIEIYDHLADTHMALGETAKAIKIWEESLKLDDISKRDKERRENVEKKLKQAKEKK